MMRALGAVGAVLEVVLENYFRGVARAEARAEVDKIMSAAIEKVQASQTNSFSVNNSPLVKVPSSQVRTFQSIVEQPKLTGQVSVFG